MEKDFDKLAEIIELDSNMLHAVMLTSKPTLMYWSALSIEVMRLVIDWRKHGMQVAYTLDAGPNVHVICTGKNHESVKKQLKEIPGMQDVLVSPVGGSAMLISP